MLTSTLKVLVNNSFYEVLTLLLWEMKKAIKILRDCLEFMFSITHHSVFIIHNSKRMGPMERKSVSLCFQVLFPSLNSLIFK